MTRSLLPAVATVLIVLACTSAARDEAAIDPDDFESGRISITVRGEGPDVILVPGLASHRDVWAAVADSLDERYRLHLVQVNGFAGAEPGANVEGPVSAPVAEELARYIDATDLERPAVIGHSMGGTIAMMLTARHPESVGRLMVVDMHPNIGTLFSPPGASAEQVRQAADTFRAHILADTAGSPDGVLEQMFPGMTQVDSMRPMLMQGVRGTNRSVAANAFHELIVTDLTPELSRITVPMTVLYVVPPEAPVPPGEFARAVRASYAGAPHARIVKVEDSAHFIMFDQPGRFVAEVDTLFSAPTVR